MSLWLNAEELVQLTGYKTASRQKLALGQMRIPFFSSAADGFPQVDRRRFRADTARSEKKRSASNWRIKMKHFQFSIVAALLAASFNADGFARTSFALGVTSTTDAERQAGEISAAHDVFGTIRNIKGSQLTIETRTGRLVQVDATEAIRAHLSVPLAEANTVEVRGTLDAQGVLHAEAILRVMDLPELWPDDR
jgi:hypothetical protein